MRKMQTITLMYIGLLDSQHYRQVRWPPLKKHDQHVINIRKVVHQHQLSFGIP